jgi:hypothetical protein
LEATFGNADAPSVIRYLMVGKRIFILTVEARTEKEAKQLAMALFASFEVLPELTRTAEVKAPAWERFQITAGKFSVLMPGKPTLAESKGPDYLGEAPMKTFTGYHPEQAMILLALYIEVPHGIRKKLTPEDILDKYGKKGRKINLGKYPGREFEAGEGKQREIMRVFVVEDRIVAVVILDLNPTQGALPRDSARYLDSLQLEKK